MCIWPIGKTFGIITLFITLVFKLGFGFVKLFLGMMENKKIKHKQLTH